MTQQRTARHPVDVQVGANVRRLRLAAGLSQSDLGRGIGVTFQQVQKYESGANRVAPSRLAGMAALLTRRSGHLVPLIEFFDEVSVGPGQPNAKLAAAVALPKRGESRQTLTLLRHWNAIADPTLRRVAVRLLTELERLDKSRRMPAAAAE